MKKQKNTYRVEGKIKEDEIYIELVRDYEANSENEASDLARADGLYGRARRLSKLEDLK